MFEFFPERQIVSNTTNDSFASLWFAVLRQPQTKQCLCCSLQLINKRHQHVFPARKKMTKLHLETIIPLKREEYWEFGYTSNYDAFQAKFIQLKHVEELESYEKV